MKNLLETIKKSGINYTDTNQVRNFLIGREVEVIGYAGANQSINGNPHGVNLGTRVKLSNAFQLAVNSDLSSLCDINNKIPSYIFFHNLRLVTPKTVKDFNEDLEELDVETEIIEEKKKEIKEIIKFMQENEVGNFDEDVYKIFKVIKKFKSSKNDIEKALEISKLLKNNK